jgi:hypothetical protein
VPAPSSTAASPTPSSLPPSGGLVLFAAGDIACAPGAQPTATTCHHAGTAERLARLSSGAHPAAVLLLGDIQYEQGRAAEFRSFDSTWGRVLRTTDATVIPMPGNHEWYDPDPPTAGCPFVEGGNNACGYAGYFGDVALDGAVAPGVQVASFGGGRHPVVVIAVDAGRCESHPGVCAPSSPLAEGLRTALADPAVNAPGACTIAAWHQARWSDVGHGNVGVVDALWRGLFAVPRAQRPDLVLNGHDHLYERMPPLGADGRADPAGIPELVVGTGGREIANVPYVGPSFARAAFLDTAHFGLLEVRVDQAAGAVTTTFVSEDGKRLDPVRVMCRT